MTQIDWAAVRLPARTVHLSNRLTVIAHRDSKAPLVAVYVCYRAGSGAEPESKAGLAHVCEHLMYTGTPSVAESYFGPMERVGATWMNAYVREDYSAYFATVPAYALDFVLQIEADRMAHLAEALDGNKFDVQREVVRNELRQRESAPFGRASRIIAEMAHPRNHPYAHPPDGVVEQLDNISFADAREWIEKRHRTANAAIVIAGDIEPEAAIEKVRRHFQALAPGRALPGDEPKVSATINSISRRILEEPGGDGRLYIVWNGPAFADPDAPAFEIACEILSGGRNSRLSRRLVDVERLASEVAMQARPRELGSQVVLSITALPGVALDQIEALTSREIERFSSSGTDEKEVAAARLRIFARLVRELQRVGGPNSKSEALGVATMLGSGPHTHDERIAAISEVGPEAVVEAGVRWLGANRATLEMRAAGQINSESWRPS
jgi:zinc protease